MNLPAKLCVTGVAAGVLFASTAWAADRTLDAISPARVVSQTVYEDGSARTEVALPRVARQVQTRVRVRRDGTRVVVIGWVIPGTDAYRD